MIITNVGTSPDLEVTALKTGRWFSSGHESQSSRSAFAGVPIGRMISADQAQAPLWRRSLTRMTDRRQGSKRIVSGCTPLSWRNAGRLLPAAPKDHGHLVSCRIIATRPGGYPQADPACRVHSRPAMAPRCESRRAGCDGGHCAGAGHFPALPTTNSDCRNRAGRRYRHLDWQDLQAPRRRYSTSATQFRFMRTTGRHLAWRP